MRSMRAICGVVPSADAEGCAASPVKGGDNVGIFRSVVTIRAADVWAQPACFTHGGSNGALVSPVACNLRIRQIDVRKLRIDVIVPRQLLEKRRGVALL